MEYRIFHDAAVPKVLDDDALEEFGRHARVPDALGVDDDDRTARAYAEAWGLASLYAAYTEKKSFSLEQ